MSIQLVPVMLYNAIYAVSLDEKPRPSKSDRTQLARSLQLWKTGDAQRLISNNFDPGDWTGKTLSSRDVKAMKEGGLMVGKGTLWGLTWLKKLTNLKSSLSDNYLKTSRSCKQRPSKRRLWLHDQRYSTGDAELKTNVSAPYGGSLGGIAYDSTPSISPTTLDWACIQRKNLQLSLLILTVKKMQQTQQRQWIANRCNYCSKVRLSYDHCCSQYISRWKRFWCYQAEWYLNQNH